MLAAASLKAATNCCSSSAAPVPLGQAGLSEAGLVIGGSCGCGKSPDRNAAARIGRASARPSANSCQGPMYTEGGLAAIMRALEAHCGSLRSDRLLARLLTEEVAVPGRVMHVAEPLSFCRPADLE
eukprot:scaffold23749_cov126-Isochrysis_galbana.AAC.2